MPKIPGCCKTSGRISQYASQLSFLAILPHNPSRSRRYVTSTEPAKVNGGPDRRADVKSPVVCPNGMLTVCNSSFFVRVAAVHTTSQQKNPATLKAAQPSPHTLGEIFSMAECYNSFSVQITRFHHQHPTFLLWGSPEKAT